ncbi:hypothetical protein K437DRAFT_259304 [Tilletiaria anomala UBC 951]|uniref:DASH complex subunit DAD1 n=1 Tax=Tilletiaria anomala (strain ATCC 24038 / CBS 436.72 / UBC 951) TaxID=1037660 RepID=A0A066VAC0_TILAU|nr:uncharacterized protein K437DRAFT_259304 [Tilletiaria anomala UBC 951]KDN38697.1 hypothetical protein K437DRAFT_259304 [Tilletiaria anomala UBC 951]
MDSTPPPATAVNSRGARSFFERERERLVTEISDGIEVIMSNSNTLNRKLEESISVGKEFEPIADLWGQFSNVMTRAGIPDLVAETAAAAAATAASPSFTSGVAESGAAAGASSGDATHPDTASDQFRRSAGAPGADADAAEGNEDGRRSRQGHGAFGEEDTLKRSLGGTGDLLGMDDLPPGVIPGGGIVYGRDA